MSNSYTCSLDTMAVDHVSWQRQGKEAKIDIRSVGNILLVQGRKTHKIFASSPDPLTMLPATVKELFPMKLYQRSRCTKRLLSYIKNQITQGVNFLKISEGIGNLNHEEHTRLEELYKSNTKPRHVKRSLPVFIQSFAYYCHTPPQNFYLNIYGYTLYTRMEK